MSRKMSRRNKFKPQDSELKQPPQTQASVAVRHTYAFSVPATATEGITVGTLLCAAGSMSTLVAGTTCVSVFSSVRVRKVSIWTPAPAVPATAPSPLVSWASAGGHDCDDEKITSSVGSAGASAFVAVPPKGSFSDLWWDSSAAASVVFTLTAAIGSVIHVDLELRMQNDLAGVSQATGAGTPGNMYYLPLDGTTTKFQAIGLPSLA